ncbi:glycoside hydrolase family protein [Magnetospirillum sp. UT-4]|uniref:glycoside hydrolase family protein n=1 Tax=Magnetospirillum sp. UT-4 TaxID=2681467 RepID=UPI00137D7A25|nr:lysozyme [Magnetospirillum sp. UT-4]CAA7621206.1 Lysozyme [Magnetospirillum sp. UT-4]
MDDFLPELVEDLRRDEGFRSKPYHCPAGKLTIGYGRNIEDNGITEREARVLLGNDAVAAIQELRQHLGWFDGLSPARKRALANMAFNLGWPRLSGFRNMLAAMAEGDFGRAATEAENSAWFRQVGDRARRIVAMIREG